MDDGEDGRRQDGRRGQDGRHGKADDGKMDCGRREEEGVAPGRPRLAWASQKSQGGGLIHVMSHRRSYRELAAQWEAGAVAWVGVGTGCPAHCLTPPLL